MKLFIFFYLSQSLLCTPVCGDHGRPQDDDHDHQPTEEKASDQIAQELAKFPDKLYSYLAAAHPNGNLLFSPSAISDKIMKEGYWNLLNQPDPDIEVDIGNILIINNKFTLLGKFGDDAKNFYPSEVIPRDSQNIKDAVKLEKTDGNIEDFSDNLDPQTEVLVNTIFFQGSWEHPFNVEDTREEDFHVDNKTIVKVQMMTRHGEYPVVFLPDIGCTVLEVPYKGNSSAIFILPEEGKLHDVEKDLHIGELQTWTKLMRPRKMFLSIPKLKISAGLDLVKELQSLDMTEVFSDLSRMTQESRPKVSKDEHRAVLNMNKEGRELAAADVKTDFELTVQYSLDDPFMFAILSKDVPTPILMGRVTNPNE